MKEAGDNEEAGVHADSTALDPARALDGGERGETVLVVDDDAANCRLLRMLLELEGYEVQTVLGGVEALAILSSEEFDLILLDVLMPVMSGVELCRAIRCDARHTSTPIVLITALDARDHLAEGLDAGADDFIQKPVDRRELLARVRSSLRTHALHRALADRERELAILNDGLEQRVAEQTAMIERLGQLKRYLAPVVADAIVHDGAEHLVRFHRARIAALCCDLRKFTAFAFRAEPEDVIDFLGDYYGRLGPLVQSHGGTIDHFTGDGMLVFFNDPIQCDQPTHKALALAQALRIEARNILADWSKRGIDMGFGSGLTYGYATMGEVGFHGRREYAGTGTPVNLASRLSSLARDGQILLSKAAVAELETDDGLESLGLHDVKGFPEPMELWNVTEEFTDGGAHDSQPGSPA